VKAVRGGIEVESEVDRGTTLRVLVPVADDQEGEPTRDSNRQGAGETILLVEDHDVVRSGLERALEAAGYRVVVASEGSAAMSLLGTGGVRPHLVLTDVVMPSMSGPELEVLIGEFGLSAPVVFMSGYPEHPIVDRLRRAGVQVLSKPVDLARLTRLLRQRLDAAAAL